MKKGLRHSLETAHVSANGQNRRPDEEGIKTQKGAIVVSEDVRTVDLMKKGLRRSAGQDCTASRRQNRRPDEEGIKTCAWNEFRRTFCVRTVDLMKKGLRRHAVAWRVLSLSEP